MKIDIENKPKIYCGKDTCLNCPFLNTLTGKCNFRPDSSRVNK